MTKNRSLLRSLHFKIAVTLVLLGSLYWHAQWGQVASAIADLDWFYLSLAVVLFVPQTIVSALRWRRFAAPLCHISLLEAVRHTLASSAWNLVTPSKLGDFSKAAMLPLGDQIPRSKGAALVAYEKLADVAAIGVLWLSGYIGLLTETYTAVVCVMAIGLVFSLCPASWRHSAVPCQRRWQPVVGASLMLWLLHLLQLDLFLKAADVFVSWNVALARIPAAIFAGLLPISVCGVGTRDSALVWLFADEAAASTMAVVGLLSASRYLIPGAIGIPLASAFRTTPAAGDGADRCHDLELPQLSASTNAAA